VIAMTTPTLVLPPIVVGPADSCGGCTRPLAAHAPLTGAQIVQGIPVGSEFCVYLLDCRIKRVCAICATSLDQGCVHLPLYTGGPS